MKWMATFTALVVALLGTASPGGAQPAITIAVPTLPPSLDPHGPAYWFPNSPLPNVYETLLARDARGVHRPGLAASWQSAQGGRILEFSLRVGVRFHNGDIMDASAVKFSLDRFLDMARSQPWGAAWRDVERIDAIAPDIVRVHGRDRVPAELWAIGGAVVSPRHFGAGLRQAIEQAVGTGPYQVADVRRGELVLKVFPQYWGPRPLARSATFTVVESMTDRVAQVKEDRAQIATDVTQAELNRAGAQSLGRGESTLQSRRYAVAGPIRWTPRTDLRLLVAEITFPPAGRDGGSGSPPQPAPAPPPSVRPPIAAAPPPPGGEPVQAPRGEDVQAPRGEDIQAQRAPPRARNGSSAEQPVPATPPTLGGGAAPAAPPALRVYNAFFEEGGDTNRKPHRLEPNSNYHLLFYIGEPTPQNVLAQQQLNDFLRTRAAAGEMIDLDLVVFCSFCVESQAIQRRTVRLGKTGNTESQRYVITPRNIGDSELVLAVEFQNMTVQNFTLPVRVGTAAAAAAGGPVPPPRPLPPLTLGDPAKVKVADLTITLVQRGDTQYRVDLVSRDRAINLQNGRSVFESDLQDTLKDLWLRLRALVRNKNPGVVFSQSEVATARFTTATRDATMLELARIGRRLYNDLFRDDPNVLAKLREFKARPIGPEPPLVYIKTLGVFLPWAIVYDGDPEKLGRGEVEFEGFWGYRYRLEGWLLDREASAVREALTSYPLNVLYGYYSGGDPSFVQRRQDQETFFRNRGQDLRLTTVGTNDALTAELRQRRSDLEVIYLYAHGTGGQKSFWADANGTPVEIWIPDQSRAAIALTPVPPPTGLVPRSFTDIFVGNEPLRLTANPIVFLNVCEGEATAAISQKNFVSSFMMLGARAVIASDAEIWQNFAQDYAKELFQRLLDPRSINDLSRVMFDLRRLYLTRDSSPWPFLYTLWGHGEYKKP